MMLSAIVAPGAAAIGLVSAKAKSKSPIGIIESRMVAVTIPIGRSRSVIGSASPRPALRSRPAASAPRIPAMIGPMILSNVQIAATPIVPAPMKRTLWTKMSPTKSSRLVPSGIAPASEV